MDWIKSKAAVVNRRLDGTPIATLRTSAVKAFRQHALGLSELETEVLEATNDEPWGPHGSAMAGERGAWLRVVGEGDGKTEGIGAPNLPLSHHIPPPPRSLVSSPDIARACADQEGYRQTLAILAKRLATPPGPDWRRPYKALLLLDFLLKHGPRAIVAEIAANGPLLDRLASFEYKDANGRDWGVNVRERAKRLASLSADPEAVTAARAAATANATKYGGVSSEDVSHGGALSFGSGGGGGGYGGGSGSGSAGPRSLSSSRPGEGGVGGGGGGDGGHSIAAPQGDPAAATAARVAALAMAGRAAAALTATMPSPPAPHPKPPGGAGMGGSVASSSGRRRLSDMSVAPAIAASFPPPAATAAAPPAVDDLLGDLLAGPTATAPATAPVGDLLGGLSLSEGAPTTTAAAPAAGADWADFQQASTTAQLAAGGDDWGAFSGGGDGGGAAAAAGAAAPDGEWDAFASSPAPPPPPPPAAPARGLAMPGSPGGGKAMAPAAAAAAPPRAADPFADLLG
jgi:epsin